MRSSSRFIVALSLLLASCSNTEQPATALPVIGTLPAFSFQDQNGKPFSSETMAGKFWVVDFIFTRCPSFCPRLTRDLASVQQQFTRDAHKVAFMSITVDPEFDKPAVLKAYTMHLGLDESNWYFVTGDVTSVKETVVKGFRVAMGERDLGKSADIVHANHFVLVDSQQRIRGYYPSDPPGLERLSNDLRQLL